MQDHSGTVPKDPHSHKEKWVSTEAPTKTHAARLACVAAPGGHKIFLRCSQAVLYRVLWFYGGFTPLALGVLAGLLTCFMPPCRQRSGVPGRSLRNAS